MLKSMTARDFGDLPIKDILKNKRLSQKNVKNTCKNEKYMI